MQRRNHRNYVQIDKYQVDFTQKLGEGGYYAPGFGDPDTLFAVKQIPINAKFEVTDSLLQQINLLRKLNHPNIVRFIDARKSLDYMYLILEYCNEGTLESLILSKRHQMSEESIMSLLAEIVVAMMFLQEKKIIHRDIKPKNILLHNGRVKIADFGVAKMIDKHTENMSFSGTVPFMSPQVIRQQKYTSLTDMWSLGVTLYFMIFRKLPWQSIHPVRILNQIVIKIKNGLVLPQDNVSPNVRQLIEKMLVMEEEGRLKWQELWEQQFIRKYRAATEQYQQSLQESTFEAEEITLNQFLQIMQNKNYDELEKRGKDIDQNYRASKIRNQLGREAYRKLLNYKQHAIFFEKILESLKEYKKKSIINRVLFLKCQYLLTKRGYIISRDLHQILSFSTHTQGVLIIPKSQFNELINDKKFRNSLKHIRNQVENLYDTFKNDWARSKQQFYKALRTQQDINLIDRGEAYTDNTQQTRNLILAFNDCFLELFFHLSKPIVQAYDGCLHMEISKSDVLIRFGVDVRFVYDLMVLLCFYNLNEKANFQSYYDKRRFASVQEIIYRIILAYKSWSKLPKQQ